MTITYFFLTLNHHEAPVVDELYKLIGNDLTFVELVDMSHSKEGKKGSTEVFSNRPYLLKAWENPRNEQKAMELARTSDVAMFCGYPSLRFQIERLKENRLSFEVSERWLKRGLYGMLSPRLMKVFLNYHIRNWRNRPLYRLCSSAFAASDHAMLGMYKGKCYKWGYFTKVEEEFVEASDADVSTKGKVRILWCARFITWKHPELVIGLAAKLKKDGCDVAIDMYGDEGSLAPHDKPYRRKDLEALIDKLGVEDIVILKGNRPNSEILKAMQEGDIFLFTSDRLEGWGAVANESMSNGCVLVASDAIGSTKYLVKDRETGMVFKSCDIDSLYESVKFLLDNLEERKRIAEAGRRLMVEQWSPELAAKSLLQLIDDLNAGKETSIKEGPCSKA